MTSEVMEPVHGLRQHGHTPCQTLTTRNPPVPPTFTSVVALLAAGLAVLAALRLAMADFVPRPGRWLLPATLSTGLLAWSLWAVLREGPLGFWHEHAHRGLWGNQIWFDLLLCALAAMALAYPQARAAGMRLLPWTLLILSSGSIGLGYFVARLWYLQSAARDQRSA